MNSLDCRMRCLLPGNHGAVPSARSKVSPLSLCGDWPGRSCLQTLKHSLSCIWGRGRHPGYLGAWAASFTAGHESSAPLPLTVTLPFAPSVRTLGDNPRGGAEGAVSELSRGPAQPGRHSQTEERCQPGSRRSSSMLGWALLG